MDFAAYKYIAQIFVVAEIVVLFLAYRGNPRLAIYTALVSITLTGHYLWLGRPIYAWQFAALLGLAFLANKQTVSSAIRPGRTLGAFHLSMMLYFMYTFVVSVPMWVIFSTEGMATADTEVSSTRIFTQTFYFILLVGLYWFGRYVGMRVSVFDLIRALIIIAAVVAYFALIQVAVVMLTGINLFPIIGSDDSVRSAYILETTFRATSFAGEPKHLGILMSIGLTGFFLARLFRVRIGGRFIFHMPLAMVLALLLSLSTTGIALTGAGIGFISIVFFHRLRKSDIAVVGLSGVAVLIWVLSAHPDFLFSLEQQLSKIELEVQDESVRLALFAEPSLFFTGTGLGNIHLIAVSYLPDSFPLFRDHGYKANSGLFFIIGDSGLVGLLFLLAAPVFGLQAYLQERRALTAEQRQEAAVALALIFVSLLSFLMRYNVLYFLLSGYVFMRLSTIRTKALLAHSDVQQSNPTT